MYTGSTPTVVTATAAPPAERRSPVGRGGSGHGAQDDGAAGAGESFIVLRSVRARFTPRERASEQAVTVWP